MNIINDCIYCATSKSFYKRKQELCGFLESDKLLSKISSDLFRPIIDEEFFQGEKFYLLTFSDLFSIFYMVHNCYQSISSEIIKIFKTEWIEKQEILLIDNGTCYTSREIWGFCVRNSINQSFTSLYNPNENGLCERINQTFEMLLCAGKGKRVFSNFSIK